jgi:hypothetical protein
MNTRFSQSLVVLLTVCSVTSIASADLIVPTAQSRYVLASTTISHDDGTWTTVDDRQDAVGFDVPFDGDVHASQSDIDAYAHQLASIAGDAIDCSGSVSGGVPEAWFNGSASATSDHSVTFEVSESLDYRLHGYINPDRYDNLYGIAECQVSFQGPSAGFSMTQTLRNPDDEMGYWYFDMEGQLAPGVYTLSVSAEASAGASGGLFGMYAAHLSVVPEPSAVALAGLLTLLARRR